MCARRSVSTAATPSAARTSSPCAHVSMSRAVTSDGGPHADAPRHADVGIERREHLAHRPRSSTPTTRSTSRPERRRPCSTPRYVTSSPDAAAAGAVVDRAGRAGRGRDRHLVGVGQVRDRVADVPPMRGRGSRASRRRRSRADDVDAATRCSASRSSSRSATPVPRRRADDAYGLRMRVRPSDTFDLGRVRQRRRAGRRRARRSTSRPPRRRRRRASCRSSVSIER